MNSHPSWLVKIGRVVFRLLLCTSASSLVALAATLPLEKPVWKLVLGGILLVGSLAASICVEIEDWRDFSHFHKPDIPEDHVRISMKYDPMTGLHFAWHAAVMVGLMFCALVISQALPDALKVALLLFGIRLSLSVAWLVLMDSYRDRLQYLILPRTVFLEVRDLIPNSDEYAALESRTKGMAFLQDKRDKWRLPVRSQNLLFSLLMTGGKWEVEE